MNAKFQPTPSRISADRKCSHSRPATATATWPSSSTKPICMMRGAPQRVISVPVKKLGANMPTTCHWITGPTSLALSPQPSIASGVAVIAMIITA